MNRYRFLDALARNLGVSKTVARGLLAAGRIATTDGAAVVEDVAREDARRVARDGHVLFDGARVALHASALVALHKPIGVVTALSDREHPTAYAVLRGAPLYGELRPIGRLDFDTSGLSLWTTEGALIQRLLHPKRAVPRTYQAALARPFEALPADLVLADGHRPRITELRVIDRTAAHPAWQPPEDAACLAEITIVGGAYHEVRRIFAALGSHVHALCRTQFGDYVLPADLAPGAWRIIEAPF